MTPYLLLFATILLLAAAGGTIVLVAVWLERQAQREEKLRLTRWLALFELDADLLFETDSTARIKRHAKKAGPPCRARGADRRRAFAASTPDIAYLSPRAAQVELNALFEA